MDRDTIVILLDCMCYHMITEAKEAWEAVFCGTTFQLAMKSGPKPHFGSTLPPRSRFQTDR